MEAKKIGTQEFLETRRKYPQRSDREDTHRRWPTWRAVRLKVAGRSNLKIAQLVRSNGRHLLRASVYQADRTGDDPCRSLAKCRADVQT